MTTFMEFSLTMVKSQNLPQNIKIYPKYPVAFAAFVYWVNLYGTKLQHITGHKRAIFKKVQLATYKWKFTIHIVDTAASEICVA